MKMNRFFPVTMLLLFITFSSIIEVQAENRENIYIKVNLWSNELYMVENNNVIKSYPISSGTENTPTPIGIFTVTEKSKSWGSGFGTRWLGLDVPWGVYGIHGTNKPRLIGKNVSSGCIRMFNQDIEELFEIIPKGTKVYIEGPITGTGKGEFKNLSVGSKGNLVQLVQERLKGLGLYEGKIDGIYDFQTEAAMKKFQKINNLPVTGGVTIREYMLLGLLE